MPVSFFQHSMVHLITFYEYAAAAVQNVADYVLANPGNLGFRASTRGFRASTRGFRASTWGFRASTRRQGSYDLVYLPPLGLRYTLWVEPAGVPCACLITWRRSTRHEQTIIIVIK